MASKFTITAELNLQTKNLNQVVNNLRQQFQGANLNIKIKDLAQAQAQLNKISSSAQSAQKSVGLLGSSFGQAFRRFTVVTAVTGTIVGFTRALKNAVGDAIEFEREVVKIAQATGKTTTQLKSLTNEISSVSSSFGVSSKELILAARSLTQAGFAADKVTGALKVLAQTELAATFDSIQDTTEGAIALLNQFGRQAQRTGSEVAFLEKSFSAINQVSKEFAVESSDLVTAIRTTGSAFESAGGSLDELLALFTSVRATTRESAESIATGFRTIFTRVQRVDTINNLKALGIQLQDAEGKFIGPIEATKRLSAALNSIDPRDFRFNLVVEELGGFRQVSKVIPLIQQFAVTQKALNVAQGSSGSLAKDAQTAQQSLAVQIAKTREEFSRFIRDLTGTESFQSTVRFLLDLANAFIKVADSIKPLVPLIAGFATFKAGTAVKGAFDQLGGPRKKNQGGKIHAFASGGLVPGSGNSDTVPAMLTPGEFVIKKSSVKKLGVNSLANANKYAGGGRVTISPEPDKYGIFALEPEGAADKDNYSTGSKVTNPDTLKKLREIAAKRLKVKKLSDDTEIAIGGTLKSFHIGNDSKDSVRQTFKDSTDRAFSQLLTTVSNDVASKVGAAPITPDNQSLQGAIGSLFKQDSKSAKNAIEGYVLEGVTSVIGKIGLAGGQENWDFPNPSGSAKNLAKLFGQESAIANLNDADAKRTDNATVRADVLATKLSKTLAEQPDNIKNVVEGKATKEAVNPTVKARTLGDLAKELEVKYAGQQFKTPGSVVGSKVSNRTISSIISNISHSRVKGLTASSPIGPELEQIITEAFATDESLKFQQTQKKALGGLIHFASGGQTSGTDTIPAMLTPGEYVINKKSAQSIGYGTLNRMNKVGKYANGGPVHFANGGGTPMSPGTKKIAAAFPLPTSFGSKVASAGNIPSSPNTASASTPSPNSQQAQKELESWTNKLKQSSDKLLVFGALTSSVVAQMGGLDKATGDLVSSFGGTFATIKGIGGNLIEFGAGIKGVKPEILKGLGAGLTGFATAQAVAATRITYLGQQAEDSGKRFDSFIESLSKGEGTTQGQLTEALTKQFRAASEAQARGSGGAKAAGAVGALAAGGIATALGAGAFAPVIASVAAPIIEEGLYQLGAFSDSTEKAKTQAEALSAAMFSATTSNRDFQKFFQSIDKQTPENVTKQAQSLAKAYGEQQSQIGKLGDLSNASESVKKRFEAVSEAAKLTAANLQTVIGVQLQNAVKRSSDLLNRGFVPDTDKLLKPVFDSIQTNINTKYANRIQSAGGENTQAGQNLVQQRNNELIIEQERARKTLNEATKQQLEMIAVLNIENNIRKDLIGSLQKQSAISASIERLSYELDLASKSVSNIDAAFSGSLTGLKSSFDTDILKLKSPDQDKLSKALDPVKAIGPIGKDLADNILNINEVMPILEAKLTQFSTATDTANGAIFNVAKFVEDSFNIKGDSLVGKTLIKLIEETTSGTGGEKAVTAAKTSLREEDVRKKIIESFQKFGEEFRTQAGGILDNLARAEQEGRAIAEKINESRQKQLELQLQSVDTFSNYIDALAKARGRDLTLLEKNTIRNMKQYALAGNMANNIGAISSELSGIYKTLSEGGLKLDQQRDLSFTATKLKSALEDLANQSGKTSDILAEIEKQRAKRESARDFGKEFTFGSNEQRQSIANSIQGLQRVLMTGNINDIPEELRSGVSSLLDRFKDVPVFNGRTGRQVENKLIANQFRAMGGGALANMIEADTSTPEQILIGELQRTFAVQIYAQQALSKIEQQKQEALQTSLGEYTDAINSYTAKLEKLVQEFQRKAEEKAIPTLTPSVITTPKTTLPKAPFSGGSMGVLNTLVENPNLPSGAKAKIDVENIQQTNEAIKNFEQAIASSDQKIYEFTARLENLVKVMENNANNTKSKTPKEPSVLQELMNKPERSSADKWIEDKLSFITDAVDLISPFSDVQSRPATRSSGGIIYRAGGGSIFQPKGTDTVPAMLTPGEFVIKKSSVDQIGVDNLKAINNGYANGGLVSYLAGGGGASGVNTLNDLVKKVTKLEERVKKLEDENKILKGMLGQVGPINQMAGSVQNMQQTMGAMVAQPAAMSFGMQMPMSSRNQARERARQRSIEKTFEEEGFGTPKAQPVSTQVENLAMPNDMAAFQVNPMVSPVELKTAAQTKEEERAALGKKLIDQAKAAQTITPEMQKAKIDQLTAENKARVEKERAEIERNRVPSLDEIANMASSPIPTYERKPQQTPEQKAAQAAEAKAKAMTDIDAKYKKLQSKEFSNHFLGLGAYNTSENNPVVQKNLQEIIAEKERINAQKQAAELYNGPDMSYATTGIEDIIPQRTVPSAEEVKKKAIEESRVRENFAQSRALISGAEFDKSIEQNTSIRNNIADIFGTAGNAIFNEKSISTVGHEAIATIQDSALAEEGRSFKSNIKKNMNLRQQLQGFASGGSTDTVPAMLTPGEFVMNRDAVSKYGKSFMEKMNRGGVVPGFASGGYVGYYAGGGVAATIANRKARGMYDGQMMTTAQAMQRSVMLRQNMMANQFANNPMVQQGVMANPMAQRPAQQASGGGNAVGAIGGGMADAAQQFSQFVTQFSDAAKMMSGMTMTHKVTVDGQLNIGGINGESIANQIRDAIGNYVGKLVEDKMSKKMEGPN